LTAKPTSQSTSRTKNNSHSSDANAGSLH
jgi:hypothetical protein